VLFWVVTCGLGLKMETVHFSEMLVSAYKSTRPHNPEDHQGCVFSCISLNSLPVKSFKYKF